MENITWKQVCTLFPKREKEAQKGDFGRLLCLTGSRNMPGACMLSTEAALRCGTGLVTVATVPENSMRLTAAVPEAMWLSLQTDADGFFLNEENHTALLSLIKQAGAILIGCGMGVTGNTRELTKWVLKTACCPVIVDADGLNCIAGCIESVRREETNWILTPHPGEMARLAGCTIAEVQMNRADAAQDFVRRIPATLALKGAGTLVAQGKRMAINSTGNPGMSRGGSGDVLAGMIASFAAQGIPAWDAVCAGVYLHGAAGDLAAQRFSEQAMLPRDILGCLPELFRRLELER